MMGFITPADSAAFGVICFPLDDPTHALPEEVAMVLVPEGLQMVLAGSGASVFFVPTAMINRCFCEMPHHAGDMPLVVLETLLGTFSFESEDPQAFCDSVQGTVAQPRIVELEFGEGLLGFDLSPSGGPNLSASITAVHDPSAIAGGLTVGSYLLSVNDTATTALTFAQTEQVFMTAIRPVKLVFALLPSSEDPDLFKVGVDRDPTQSFPQHCALHGTTMGVQIFDFEVTSTQCFITWENLQSICCNPCQQSGSDLLQLTTSIGEFYFQCQDGSLFVEEVEASRPKGKAVFF